MLSVVNSGGTALFGRARELAGVAAMLDAAAYGPAALLFCGPAGVGKTALLGAATAEARRREYRIQHATPAAVPQPFGLLRRLLGTGGAGLPGHLYRRLTGLWAPRSPGGTPDDAAVVTALLLALEGSSRGGPLLIVADDAHRADQESLRLLGTALHHTSTERIALLLAARDGELPGPLINTISRYDVGPLAEDAAGRLLGACGSSADARTRGDILRRAAGNPLALRVLGDPGQRLPYEFLAQVRALPAPARRLLLHAALAGDGEHLGTLHRAAGVADWAAACAEAERAGLIVVRDGIVHFRHPLTRAACVAAETPANVARAHRELAAATDDVYRRARHLATLTPGRDASVAAALEAAADDALGRGDELAGATALQSAAEHSSSDLDAARHYARASLAAHRGGQPEWAIELAAKVTAATGDTDLTGVAACSAGLALVHAARPGEAFEVTARAARSGPRDAQVTLNAVLIAAVAALLSGVRAHREQLPELLSRAGNDGGRGKYATSMIPLAQAESVRWIVTMISDPATFAGDCPEPAGPLLAGTAAFLRDESTRAAVRLGAVWNSGAPGAMFACYPLMVLALIDSGRWAEADRVLDRAVRVAAVGPVPFLDDLVPALRVTLQALRDDSATDLDAPSPGATTLADSVRQRAVALRALTAGDYPRAYREFRRLFDEDGEPRHYFFGPRSLPQLALAAAHTGHAQEAARILARARRAAGAEPTARMVMLLAHAAALLDDTEESFREALADPERALHWPLEYAEAQLNLGMWLCRRKRALDARPYLLAARDTFLRLGAGAHADQARRALPVALRPAGEPAPEADGFRRLTAQKQMIARMAAAGMSNREIADRFFLSPRTVGSHLYRIYAELGVGSRHQLRVIVDAAR
ncbi:LuxR family transcriptional regulator [Actinoplanes cyaneus]|uniref:helix-turn-helix transcriptional regulator n=1 Tax=Actinoplanes cyaneus TaxID=52696 RepID=UPI0031DC2171